MIENTIKSIINDHMKIKDKLNILKITLILNRFGVCIGRPPINPILSYKQKKNNQKYENDTLNMKNDTK